MKVTICGSMVFADQMLEVKGQLEAMGHEVQMPPMRVQGKGDEEITTQEFHAIRTAEDANEAWIWERKAEAMQRHFDKVAWSDAILVLNYEKNGIPGYIGANTLMELGLAFFLKKQIYLLNEVPQIPAREEILGVQPTILNGSLEAIQS